MDLSWNEHGVRMVSLNSAVTPEVGTTMLFSLPLRDERTQLLSEELGVVYPAAFSLCLSLSLSCIYGNKNC